MKQKVTIAGGGLAGLSLGIGLRRAGVPVCLVEAGSYPRHRVCGEFISGVSVATLEELGVTMDLADSVRHREVVWFREGKRLLEFALADDAMGISRCRLDRRLSERFENLGGVLRCGTRMARKTAAGLVWTAGRPVRRSEWIGLKCHFKDLELERGLEMHMGSNGYLGLAEVEDGRVNACGLFRLDRSLKGKGPDLLGAYLMSGGQDTLVERLGTAIRDDSSFLGVAGFTFGWQSGEPGECRVGDADVMIPPFTGNGMSMAFEYAELALPWLCQWSAGDRPWNEVVGGIRQEAQSRFGRRLKHACRLQRLLMSHGGRALVSGFSRLGVMPVRQVLSLVR